MVRNTTMYPSSNVSPRRHYHISTSFCICYTSFSCPSTRTWEEILSLICPSLSKHLESFAKVIHHQYTYCTENLSSLLNKNKDACGKNMFNEHLCKCDTMDKPFPAMYYLMGIASWLYCGDKPTSL